MLIGYARVSTTEQTLDLQRDALKSAGCDRIFTDTASGSTTERKGLDQAFSQLRDGDVLAVWRLDRLGRSLRHLIETITALNDKGIGFRSLTEQIDTTTSGGKLIFHIFGALEELGSCDGKHAGGAQLDWERLHTPKLPSELRVIVSPAWPRSIHRSRRAGSPWLRRCSRTPNSAPSFADGLNLGLTRMAEACSIASLGQLAWTADWHIREETYALALRCLVNQQQREPFAAIFGSGTASSSDGQFFQAGFGRAASRLNAHYGQQSGFKVYTHLSDRYGPFFTKLIAATASEALHVLDALLYHQSDVSIRRHHTDGGGDSDHVFALCALLGFQFAPRIPGLKHRRFYSFGRPSGYPTLEPLIAGRINVALIRAHWSEILRIIASIRTGTVIASLIMRQLASYPRQNGVAAALRELGRLERTLFTLDWIEDPELRRTTGQELNKGEARNSLARAVFIHRLGEIRDRTYENQQHRASGLNLLVTAIILWNTRYLERAVATLCQTEDVPDHLLAHLSPLGWEHVNLTGDYVWGAEQAMSKNNDGLRPLRTPPAAFLRAA